MNFNLKSHEIRSPLSSNPLDFSWITPNMICWHKFPHSEDPQILYKKAYILSFDREKNLVKIKISESSGSQFLELKSLPNQIFETDAQSLLPANPIYIPQGFDDMVKMTMINEAEILGNLQSRFNKNMVYTYIDDILLYILNRKVIDNLFSKNNELFFGKIIKKASVFSLKDFAPHLYSLIINCFQKAFENKKSQVIFFLGFSGSGKSLNLNKGVEFLASLNNEKPEDFEFNIMTKSTFFDVFEEKFNAANQILSLFGNSRSIINENSSRFLKFFQVLLNKKKRKIEAGIVDSFFLEKTRITRKPQILSQDSNFKIFYSLFHDFPENLLKILGLMTSKNQKRLISDFEILKTEPIPAFFNEDEQIYQGIMKNFNTLGFKEEEILTIFKILASILMLTEAKNPENRNNLASILEIDQETLISFLDSLSEARISELSNEIYCQLFKSLIRKINTNLLKEPLNSSEISNFSDFKEKLQNQFFSNTHPQYLSINFIETLGFEVHNQETLNSNGFYALKSNYLNEKLQQFYLENVFKSEEIEFLIEGLRNESTCVFFIDNLNIIEIFENKNHENLNLLLMEIRDKANKNYNQKTLEKEFSEKFENIVKKDKNNVIFINKSSKSFVILHSASEIEYKYENFISLNSDISNVYQSFEEEILISSKNPVFSHLLSKKPAIDKKEFCFEALSEKFGLLMKNLNLYDKYYVKCISSAQKPLNIFNCLYISQQLKSFNCENLLRFKKEGFLIKKSYKQFYHDYSKLANITINLKFREQTLDYRKIVEYIIETIIPEFFSRKKVLFGKNRVFLNPEALIALDNKLMVLWKKQNEKASIIQKNYQCFKFRNNLKLGNKGFKGLLKAIIKLQAKKKSNKQRNIFLSKKKAIGMIEEIEGRLEKKVGFNRFYKKIKEISLKKKNVRFQEKNDWQFVGKTEKIKEFHEKFIEKSPCLKNEEKTTFLRFEKNQKKNERDHSAIKEKERKKTIQIKNHMLKRLSSKSSDYLKSQENAVFSRFMSENDCDLKENSNKRRKCIAAKSFTDFENKSRNSALEEYLEISARKTFVPKDIRDFPVSPDLNFNFESLDKTILKEIEKNECENVLMKRFMKKYQKIMSFQNKALENPLLDFPKKYHKTCKKCFKYILQYSGDRKMKFKPFQQLLKLLKIMLNEHDSMRDEVYLQILKQMNNNPSPLSLINLHRLLAIVASFIAPSEKFYFVILNFLWNKAIKDVPNSPFARYTFVRMMRSKERGLRKNLPLMNEVTCIELNRMILIPIYLLSGEHVLISFESYASVDEILEEIVKKFKISHRKKNLGLFLMSKTRKNNDIFEEEICLSEESNMLDNLAGWENIKRENEALIISFKVVLKIKFFFELDSEDNDDVTLYYIQMVRDFLQGKYVLQEEDVINLASCKMAVDHGDFSAEKVRFLKINIEDYIPADFIEGHKPQNWIDRILINYLQMKTYSKVMGKKKLLDFLKKFKMYASHQFLVVYSLIRTVLALKQGVLENIQEVSVQRHRLLIITMKTIQICEGKGLEMIDVIEFAKVKDIKSIEANNEVIIEEEDKKHIIISGKNKEIEQLVRFYKNKGTI